MIYKMGVADMTLFNVNGLELDSHNNARTII